MSQISRAGEDHPHKNTQRSAADSQKRREFAFGNKARRLRAARNFERIGSQQFEEWIACVAIAFGKRHQTLLEFGEYVFGLASRSPTVERRNRHGNPKRK